MIPVHYLQVYEKPKISATAFLKRYPVAGYKHKILANGGFDTASCTIPVSIAEGETIYENYVGNRVAVIVNNPFEPIFEGLISRITYTTPGLTLTRSLDQMGNRTRINLAADVNPVPTSVTVVNDTTSQSIYGIKEKVLRAARRSTAPGVGTYSASLASRALNDIAYPLTSVSVNDGNVNAVIEIEIKGFYYTMDWENQTSTVGLRNIGFSTPTIGWVQSIVSLLANGTTFLDNTSDSEIAVNAQTYNAGTNFGQTAWKTLQMLAECGNNAQRFIVGVTPTDLATNTRKVYYRAADTTVKYLAKVNKPGQLFTPANTFVPPWTVRPDGVVKMIDVLVGWDGGGIDPRLAYLAYLEYDADTQRVNWQSDDNIQLSGALEVDRWHSQSEQRYGQRASDALM